MGNIILIFTTNYVYIILFSTNQNLKSLTIITTISKLKNCYIHTQNEKKRNHRHELSKIATLFPYRFVTAKSSLVSLLKSRATTLSGRYSAEKSIRS